MRKITWAVALLWACGGEKDATDDVVDTTADTTETADTTDTDVADTTETTDTDAADTDVADTDVADTTETTDTTDTTDTTPAGDTTPPLPMFYGPPDYTWFFDGAAINLYWRDASDDVTPTADLEYKVNCQPVGMPPYSILDWTVATDLEVEGSGRYWSTTCVGVPGTYTVWVSVRDAAGNVTQFPTFNGEIVRNEGI
jgi:hypothetical protein